MESGESAARDYIKTHGMRADEVMTADPLTIRPQALAAEALGFMSARKITFLFVVEDGQPVGFVHMHDCLKAGVA